MVLYGEFSQQYSQFPVRARASGRAVYKDTSPANMFISFVVVCIICSELYIETTFNALTIQLF